MTYCVNCELYVACQRRQDQNRVPFHCDLYRRQRNLEARDLPYMGA